MKSRLPYLLNVSYQVRRGMFQYPLLSMVCRHGSSTHCYSCGVHFRQVDDKWGFYLLITARLLCSMPLISTVVASLTNLRNSARNSDRASARKLARLRLIRRINFICRIISCNTGKVWKSSIFPTWCRDKCHQMTLKFGGQRMSWKQGAMAFCWWRHWRQLTKNNRCC